MTLSDPLGDMLTRIRNGQAAHKAAVTSPASRLRESTCSKCCSARATSAASSARRIGHGELSIELKYHNGEPVIRELRRVSQAGPAGLLRRSRTCRASTTGSASRSCRRRAASCPTPRRARRMSAARSCARCSDHVADRQASGSGARRASRWRSTGQTLRCRASSASSSARCRPRSRSPRRTARIAVQPARRRQARARDVGPVAHPGRQHGGGRVQGLHAAARDQRRRLSRGDRRQDPQSAARLQPRHQVRDPGRHRGQRARPRPRSRSPAPTASGSARSRPRCARSASPSPTRARASATTTRSILRKEGKKK